MILPCTGGGLPVRVCLARQQHGVAALHFPITLLGRFVSLAVAPRHRQMIPLVLLFLLSLEFKGVSLSLPSPHTRLLLALLSPSDSAIQSCAAGASGSDRRKSVFLRRGGSTRQRVSVLPRQVDRRNVGASRRPRRQKGALHASTHRRGAKPQMLFDGGRMREER